MTYSHPRVDSQTIVVGTDGSADADVALEWAVNEARQSGRRLVVVHVAPMSEAAVLAPLTLIGFKDTTSYGTEVLQRAERHCRQAGVPVLTSLGEGPPADRLVEVSEKAAMLVLGARGHGHTASLLLGSVSQDCARRAGCPVVLVKPAAARHPAQVE